MLLWPPRNTYIITECLTNLWYSHYSLLELLNVMCVRFMTQPGVWLCLRAGTCVGLSRCEHLPLWIRISRGVCMCTFLVFGGCWCWCLLCNLFFLLLSSCLTWLILNVHLCNVQAVVCLTHLPTAIKWRRLIMLYDDILGVAAHSIAYHLTCLGWTDNILSCCQFLGVSSAASVASCASLAGAFPRRALFLTLANRVCCATGVPLSIAQRTHVPLHF